MDNHDNTILIKCKWCTVVEKEWDKFISHVRVLHPKHYHEVRRWLEVTERTGEEFYD